MAVYEATGIPAVSLPNGASNLPTQMITFLDRMERIYLWMDNDEVGQMNVESFANKLGPKRTYIVQTDSDGRSLVNLVKDANDALRRDPKLVGRYIEKAAPMLSKNLVSYRLMTDKIREPERTSQK